MKKSSVIQTAVATHRLTQQEYVQNFSIPPLLSRKEALIESERCYYCYDAPCIEACPTGINIPSFIKKIAHDNIVGAAQTILTANIFGGTCARVCPVDTLCESVCVRETSEQQPVKIGQLQRYAVEHFFGDDHPYPFERDTPTGKKIAIIGAGPAGLACAHRLASYGHDVFIYEKDNAPGGLNRDGLARYKVTDAFISDEIDFLLKIGGIHIEYNQALGRDIHLESLRKTYDAVFLSVGLQKNNSLALAGESLQGVMQATDYIARLRHSDDLSALPVGKHIIVVGGGNTAIDIASQVKRLGATSVTILYRRGKEYLKATPHEQSLAQNDGISLRCNVIAKHLIAEEHHVVAIECEETIDEHHGVVGTGHYFTLPADMVFIAIGQRLDDGIFDTTTRRLLLNQTNQRIEVSERMETVCAGVFAGGDCVNRGGDLTVDAVQQGKIAAENIHHYMLTRNAT